MNYASTKPSFVIAVTFAWYRLLPSFFVFFLKLFSYKDAPTFEIVYGTSVSNHSINDFKFVILLKLVLTPTIAVDKPRSIKFIFKARF